MGEDDVPNYFAVFNEIGIIAQLARAAMEDQLPDGMILPHFSVLNHLIRVRDGQTPLVLARAFQVPKTSMTHTLAGLGRRGLIEMRANPSDARSKCVWITVAGRRLRNQAIADLVEAFEPVATRFTKERAEAMLPELRALRKIMDAARD
ncbi:MAG: MarR family winged helix-turn-helix transcriptional regulator [Pseudomonadota bacterium]